MKGRGWRGLTASVNPSMSYVDAKPTQPKLTARIELTMPMGRPTRWKRRDAVPLWGRCGRRA